MKKHKETIFMIMAIVCIIIFGTALAPIELQNDTFYTIKIGQYIMENGISEYDPFSWHEALPYTFPHWLYDVVIGSIYNLGGMFGVYLSTVGFTIILGIVWFLVNCKLTKNKLSSFILSLALIYLMSPYIAARAQLITFTMFVLEVYFIERFLTTKKLRYAIGLIILPAIIANVHAAVFPFYFVLFLPYIGEYVMAALVEFPNYFRKFKLHIIDRKLRKGKVEEDKKPIVEEKAEKLQQKIIDSDNKTQRRRKNPYKLEVVKNENVKWLILIMIICALTGFLTPIGDTPYTYLVKTMEGNTTSNINEHLPLTLIYSKPQLCLIVLCLAVLIFTDVKIRLKDLFMLGGLLLLALISRRQLSMFVLMGLTIFNTFVAYLANKYDKEGCPKFIQHLQKPIGILSLLLLVLVMCIPFVKPKMDTKFVSESSYPVAACDYILENLDVNNIKLYNEYNYGSYLIYRGIPVFIDSRADLYTPEFNGDKDRDIFTDFLNASSLSIDYNELFEKYGITHLLIYKNSKMDLLVSRDLAYNKLYEDNNFILYEKTTI